LARPESPQKVVDKRIDGARYLAERGDLGWHASDILSVANEITRGLDR